jgi:hypothetical protein
LAGVIGTLVMVGVLTLRLMPAPSPEQSAEALFHDGEARYETHDYAGAIEAFTDAYAHAQDIADPGLRDQVLSRLAFNLARAHVAAFDIDGDREHLVLARKLIADYRGHERALGRDPDEDTDVQRLEADLGERERAGDDAGIAASPRAEQVRLRKRNAGISLLVVSVPMAGLAVAGAVVGSEAKQAFESVTTGDARRSAQSRGRTGDLLVGLGVGLAVLSAVSGAALLGVSMKGKHARVQARVHATGFEIVGAF